MKWHVIVLARLKGARVRRGAKLSNYIVAGRQSQLPCSARAARVQMLVVLVLVLSCKIALESERQPDLAVQDTDKRLAEAQRYRERKPNHRTLPAKPGAQAAPEPHGFVPLSLDRSECWHNTFLKICWLYSTGIGCDCQFVASEEYTQ